jgi:hypothetical protein
MPTATPGTSAKITIPTPSAPPTGQRHPTSSIGSPTLQETLTHDERVRCLTAVCRENEEAGDQS